MKKLILMASALMLGGVAQAQDMSQPGTTTPAPATPDASMPPASPGAMPMTPDASAPPPAPMAPDSTMPPAGQDGTMPPAASSTGSAMAAPSSGDLPTCSKSVTDSCKEGGGMHHASKHRRHK